MSSQVQVVQQDLQRHLNINMKITKLDYTTYYGRYVEGKWDGMSWGFQSGHAVDLDERTYQYMHSSPVRNASAIALRRTDGYGSPMISRLWLDK